MTAENCIAHSYNSEQKRVESAVYYQAKNPVLHKYYNHQIEQDTILIIYVNKELYTILFYNKYIYGVFCKNGMFNVTEKLFPFCILSRRTLNRVCLVLFNISVITKSVAF